MIDNLTDRERTEKSHFDSYASVYDQNYGYLDSFTKYKISKKINEFSKFVKENTKHKNINILEVGCGTGEYTKKIAMKFPHSTIVAMDISPEIIKVARKKCKNLKNIKFVVGSAYKTKYPKDRFDVVCGFYVLHHLEVDKFRTECNRLLKKNGIGFFYEPNILNPLVYIIKSNKVIKKRIGDSPDEWAMNPIVVKKLFPSFRVETEISEFIYPFKFLNLSVLKRIDKLANNFSQIPILKYFGGSVQIMLFKE